MSSEQLRRRDDFVARLAAAGWRGTNDNHNFDEGLWSSPEASMTYGNRVMSLRLELIYDDPRLILYIASKEGKSLGLVFKCWDRQRQLLDAVIAMQDNIAPENIKEVSEGLLAACPEMFKISASGDRLIPVKSKKSR